MGGLSLVKTSSLQAFRTSGPNGHQVLRSSDDIDILMSNVFLFPKKAIFVHSNAMAIFLLKKININLHKKDKCPYFISQGDWRKNHEANKRIIYLIEPIIESLLQVRVDCQG